MCIKISEGVCDIVLFFQLADPRNDSTECFRDPTEYMETPTFRLETHCLSQQLVPHYGHDMKRMTSLTQSWEEGLALHLLED